MDLSKYTLTADEDGNTYINHCDDPTFSTRKMIMNLADAMAFVVERETRPPHVRVKINTRRR